MNENKLDYYMNLKYEVVVEPSDDGYVVYIPELPGCITQTDDASEIISMITDAKRCWLEVALEKEMPVPLPKKVEDYSGTPNFSITSLLI